MAFQVRATPTGRHLPLDGGGWEGVTEPEYCDQSTP